MGLSAGKLRHRLRIERPVETRDETNGAVIVSWQTVANVWGEIAPISAREFIAADAMANRITSRITIRYRNDITPKMRIFDAAKGTYYNIEGILADKISGMEYLTLPCSDDNVNYPSGNAEAVIPENLTLPSIIGEPHVASLLVVDLGDWANDPVSYSYQWYKQGVAISGATNSSLVVPNNIGQNITVGIIATNTAGSSTPATSAVVTIEA